MMINFSEGGLIDGRSIFEQIKGSKARYNDVIRSLVKKGFVEGVDFFCVLKTKKVNNLKNQSSIYKSHDMTIDMTKKFCEYFKGNQYAYTLLEELHSISEDKVIFYREQRKEEEFLGMLSTFFKPYGVEIQTQVNACNGKYRIDFMIGLLAIEYDETHHNSIVQSKRDEKRMKEINEWFLENNTQGEEFPIEWIRVKEGEELLGLSTINMWLITRGYLDECGYCKGVTLKECFE